MNMHRIGAAVLAGAAGSTLLLSASGAGARTVTSAQPQAIKSVAVGRAKPLAQSNLPQGYVIVTSSFTDYAGTQGRGVAQCPGTEQPTGGGAVVTSSDLSVNINSSYPDGSTWAVDVNNPTNQDTNVTVYAVCMAYSPSYRVVTSALTTAYSFQVSSQATACPRGTVVTGGGAESNTANTDVSVNSTVPNTFTGGRTGWRVAMASSDYYNTGFTVYAVCRSKVAGYSIQYGPLVSNGPYAENSASVTCPGASVPIGGGGFSAFQTNDAWIGMNSTFPVGKTWIVYENDYQIITRSLGAAAICAGS